MFHCTTRHFSLVFLLTTTVVSQAETDTGRADEVEEIVVVASKIERPLHRVAGQITQFHRDDLVALQIQNISEIARYEPALEAEFSGNRFGNNGLSVRGIGGNRVAMEVDGVPLPQHFAVGEFANTARTLVDPNVTQRVEVLRGPASSLYGSDAIGGVVAITTADPLDLTEISGTAYLGGGAVYRGSDHGAGGYLSHAVTGDLQGGLISVSQHHSHELDNHVDTATADSIDTKTSAVIGKWTLSPTDNLAIRATADYYRRDSMADLRTVLGFGRQYRSTLALNGDDRQDRSRLSLEVRHEPDRYLDQATLLMFYQQNETYQQTRDLRGSLEPVELIERQFSFSEKQQGIEAKIRRDFATGTAGHILVAGIEWERDRLSEFRDGLVTQLVTGETSKHLPPGEVLPQRDLPHSVVRSLGLYLQDEIHLGSWTLIPGIRWDSFHLDASIDQLITDADRLSDLEDSSLSARLGLTRQISDALTAFAHYSQGFRAPPPEDVNLYLEYSGFVNVRALPNPDLQPETSRNYELGLRYRRGRTALVAGGYRTDFRRFIESRERVGVDPADGALLFQSRNIANAKIEGFELELTQDLSSWSESLDHWSWGLAFHTSRGTNIDSGQPINRVSPAKTVARLTWRPAAHLSASLFAVHYDTQARTDTSGGDFFVPASSTVIDFSGHWSPRPSVDIRLGINNVTDRRYWRYSDVRIFAPGDPRIEALARPGRNLTVSIHLKH